MRYPEYLQYYSVINSVQNLAGDESRRNHLYFEPPYPQWWDKLRALVAQAVETTPMVDLHPKYQPNVDFPGLKAEGFGGTITKIVDGITRVDGATEYVLRAQDAGLVPMVYSFFRGNLTGEAQSNEAMNTAALLADRLGFRPVIFYDVETGDGVTVSVRVSRLNLCLYNTNKYWVEPGVYSSPYLWKVLTNGMVLIYKKWLAHWTSGQYTLPEGWDHVDIHQIGVSGKHTWVPKVESVEGTVDYDLFFGSFAQLKEYAGWVDPVPPDPDLGEIRDQLAQLSYSVTALDERIDLQATAIAELAQRVTALENQEPQPEPAPERTRVIVRVTHNEKAVAHYDTGIRDGRPVMAPWGEIVGSRIKWLTDERLEVFLPAVTADGGSKWFEICPDQPAGLQQIPSGVPTLYINKEKVTQV